MKKLLYYYGDDSDYSDFESDYAYQNLQPGSSASFDFYKGQIAPPEEDDQGRYLEKMTEVEINNRYIDYVNKMFRWASVRGKPGIERKNLSTQLREMRALASHFGNPQRNLKIIHVAGTNGKGSVSLKVAKTLEKLGFKTGLFTSPHINSFRERITVNQQLTTKVDVIKHCDRIVKAVDQNHLDMRFFEILTMMAFLEFQAQGCEYAVLECGIGGRLDSTNIVDEPVCSAITTIGHDHMDVIGNTLDEIAFEKAGVIKTGAPCVIGPTCSDKQAI